MRKHASQLINHRGGAVAPTVALSLFALIAAGGLAFDYARLASMDTELQNAADQAALAAASQLDGQAGACSRAAAAAAGMLTNNTLFANDGAGAAVQVLADAGENCAGNEYIQFYKSYDHSIDDFGDPATGDSDASIVAIRVEPREAFYALTPVVAAFSSGNIGAGAVAGLGSAMCKVPPVMMCNPAEPNTNTDPNLDFDPEEGAGLRLVISTPDAPGNFGFLRTEESGAKGVAKMLGYDNPPHGCIATTGVETEPGNMISVRDAYNTRFDIYDNGATACPDGGTCSPSINARKDLVRKDECTLSNKGWQEAADPYRPTSPTTPLDGTDDPEIMGYPRDICHAVSVPGACTNPMSPIVGNGKWDIDAFFRVNYGWDHDAWMLAVKDSDGNRLAPTEADVENVSRYDIYLWEMANAADEAQGVSGGLSGHVRPICQKPGITPSPSTPDRRRISVAVVNCKAQGLKGHETGVHVTKWLDVFLVEPAVDRGSGGDKRTTAGDIYVEVIGVTSSGTSGEVSGQVARRDVPYLIR